MTGMNDEMIYRMQANYPEILIKGDDHLLGWRELFLTFDTAALLNVTRKLDEADIEYEIRTDDFGRSNRGSGVLGNLGENKSQKIMHYVYVKKKDYDLAKAVIDGNVHK